MGARDLLHNLHDAGFRLDVADGKLLVTPASRLTDDQRSALRASKPELVALLTQPTADTWNVTLAPGTPPETIAKFRAASEVLDALIRAEAYEERAAIMEFDGGTPRADAEAAARLEL